MRCLRQTVFFLSVARAAVDRGDDFSHEAKVVCTGGLADQRSNAQLAKKVRPLFSHDCGPALMSLTTRSLCRCAEVRYDQPGFCEARIDSRRFELCFQPF